ncbi:MAG TPA: tetratricopeptide repeat protein [Nitrospira sp.]|nr:tetratricopeptide repeat protein [Nitrospira sp.]
MRRRPPTKSITTGIVLLAAFGFPAVVPANARERNPPPPPTKVSGPASPAAEVPLPDAGPRYDSRGDQESKDFDEVVAAYQRGAYEEAQAGFDAILLRRPESALAGAAAAFRAELTVLRDPTTKKRAEAVAQYRTLLRTHPNDVNAIRAQWRIGDLYREMGWLHESKSAYEQALSRAEWPEDRERAMLGLGFAAMALGQWKEAERAFQGIRTNASDDRMLLHATRGLAGTLHGARRDEEARPLYDVLYRRWPAILKQDPTLLAQYCGVLFDTNHLLQARDICTLFGNLYPLREDAGAALLRTGDSCRRLGQQKCSELFYLTVRRQYPDSPAAAAARLRLVAMEQEVAAAAEEDFLYLKVRGMVRGAAPSYLEPSEFVRLYEELAAEHEADMLGSEALFRLGQFREQRGDGMAAIRTYYDVTARAGLADDPWPGAAGQRLVGILRARLEAALNEGRALDAITLFHWHGRDAEQHYLGTDLLLRLADVHRLQGFPAQAIRLYQALVRDANAAPLHETALIGLGYSYLDQRDYASAQKVFERARFLYPLSPNGATVSRLVAMTLVEQGNRQGAARLMRSWLQRRGNDAARGPMQVLLAKTVAELGQTEEAIALLNDAFRLGAPRTAGEVLLLADLMSERREDRAAVLGLYREVLALHPDEDQAAWAHVQIVRNLARQPRVPAGTTMPSAEAIRDPLLKRASMAIQASLRLMEQPKGVMP